LFLLVFKRKSDSVLSCIYYNCSFARLFDKLPQRSDHFGLRVELPPVTTSLTTQR